MQIQPSQIPIEQLTYETDPEGLDNQHHYVGVYKGLCGLEYLLRTGHWSNSPVMVKFQKKSFPRLFEVYESVKKEGLINPLLVKAMGKDKYRVIIGNQRLCCLRATGHKGSVLCKIIPESVSPHFVRKKTYEYVEGTEAQKSFTDE